MTQRNEQTYEQPSSGAFTRARSHIIMIVGLVVASGAAVWLESLDPAACRPVGQAHHSMLDWAK